MAMQMRPACFLLRTGETRSAHFCRNAACAHEAHHTNKNLKHLHCPFCDSLVSNKADKFDKHFLSVHDDIVEAIIDYGLRRHKPRHGPAPSKACARKSNRRGPCREPPPPDPLALLFDTGLVELAALETLFAVDSPALELSLQDGADEDLHSTISISEDLEKSLLLDLQAECSSGGPFAFSLAEMQKSYAS